MPRGSIRGILLFGAICCGTGVLGTSLICGYKISQWSDRCAGLQQENARLAQENAELRGQLDALQKAARTKGQELVISIRVTEFSPLTLAQKNRNLLNIKAATDCTWKGQIGRDRHGHAIFESPAWSIRAGAITLLAYQDKHGIKTVRGLVERFSETNRNEYISHLCRALRVGSEQEISFRDRLPDLLKAMVRFECGQVLGQEQLELISSLR